MNRASYLVCFSLTQSHNGHGQEEPVETRDPVPHVGHDILGGHVAVAAVTAVLRCCSGGSPIAVGRRRGLVLVRDELVDEVEDGAEQEEVDGEDHDHPGRVGVGTIGSWNCEHVSPWTEEVPPPVDDAAEEKHVDNEEQGERADDDDLRI